MIDREHDLPLGRQAELLKLSRSSIYYEPQPVPPGELAIMRQIDELHLNYSPLLFALFFGAHIKLRRHPRPKSKPQMRRC